MRLPSSSSLIVASLAVSLSSSSSLSALAAPTGDLPEDSSSPNSVAHCRDGVVVRSVDHPQSRGILSPATDAVGGLVGKVTHDVSGLVGQITHDVLGLLARRDSESAADEDSISPDSTTAPPQPPAPPSSPGVNPPVPPRNPVPTTD